MSNIVLSISNILINTTKSYEVQRKTMLYVPRIISLTASPIQNCLQNEYFYIGKETKNNRV